MELMETSLRRRGENGKVVVVSRSDKTGLKRQKLQWLTIRILIRKPPDPQYSLPRLHVMPQHQLLGVGMQIHLLVYPTLRWAQAPSQALNAGSGDA